MSLTMLGLASGCGGVQRSLEDPAITAWKIANLLVDDTLESAPDMAANLREPGTRYDGLPDDSIAGVEARAHRRRDWLIELRRIDCAKLADPARLACEVARVRLEDLEALRVCRFELWTVSQMLNGWQVRFGNLAYAQPVGTPELQAQALSRFSDLPAYVDAQIDNLRAGLKAGYRASAVNVRLVIDQMSQLVATPVAQSPFFSPAERDGDPAFRAAFYKLVEQEIHPALQRYRDYLRKEYLPQARDSIGVSALPNGAACYRASLRYATSLNVDPEKVHRLGAKQLSQLEQETDALAARAFGGQTMAQLLKRFRSEREYLYTSPGEMLRLANHTAARTYRALPRWFGLLPTSEAVIEPIPAYQERSAAPHYLSAALDGSRPAAYRVRLYQAEKQSWVGGESTAFHEVVPGHHLQINIANRLDGLPRISRFLFFSGFGEGWGLYAERLADEMRLYSTDPDLMGMISNFRWRAVRMLVDTGIHTLGWSRQRAVDLLLANTALSPDQAAAEVDRYIAWPGQAPSYMLGYLEIRHLRRLAEKSLGSRFDIRGFHDAVLRQGNVPLPVLRRRVKQWISEHTPDEPVIR